MKYPLATIIRRNAAVVAAPAATTHGLRRANLTARSHRPTGRAWIGSPARKRRRSSASSAARAVAPGRLLVQAFQADRFQVMRHLGLNARGRHRLLVLHLVQRVQDGGALERRPAGQQLVEDGPQGIDVGRRAGSVARAAGLLRGHVAGRAHDGAAAASARTRLPAAWPGRSR